MPHLARFLPLALTTALVGWSASSRAEVSATATARELALQGIDLVEHGDCARGQSMLEGAEKLHHASVHLQYIARCKAKEGHLVAATELWRQIVREGAPAGASPAIAAAVVEATAELDKTLPRLASTTFRTAASYPDLELSLDGAPLPSVVVGSKQVVDPGSHELVVHAKGFAPWKKNWTLAEGASADIDIQLAPATGGEGEDGKPGTGVGGDKGTQGSSTLTTVGWITTTTGGVAVVAGVVTWLTRNSRRDQLAKDCADGCPRPQYDEGILADKKQSITDLTTATNILLFGGGALVAGGATMVLLGGKSQGSSSATLAPAVGPHVAGLSLHGKW